MTPSDSPAGGRVSRRAWLEAAGAGAALALAGPLLANEPAVTSAPRIPSDLGARTYNVRDHGARGDGKTLDTAAVQAAVDACHRDGGGTVLVPAGTFVIGTVELKSHVTLHLAAQAVLLGSGNGRDYRAADAIPLRGEHTMGDGNVGLLFAADAVNVTIEGPGTIDGQGALFRAAERGGTPPSGVGGNRRPHHLLFYKCENLVIRGLFLKACAYHSVRVCVCRHVRIDGLRIHSRVNGNNDGFHFISSHFVHVTNCDVQCQDDACALFGSCTFVTITNCTFSTRWSVFRFGTGHAENIVVSNCVIYETYGCPIKMRCDSRSRYQNISFSNIVMDRVTGPISIGLGPQRPERDDPAAPPGIVRNISFNGIRATVVKPVRLPEVNFGGDYHPGEIFSCLILNGMGRGFIENVSFHDVHVTFPGGGTREQGAMRAVPEIASEYYVIGVPPAHGLYARNVRGLVLHNVRFDLATADARPALVFDRVEDAALTGLSVAGDLGAESTCRFIACRDVLLQAPRVTSPTTVFLRTEGGHHNVVLDDRGLGKAQTVRVDAAGQTAGG